MPLAWAQRGKCDGLDKPDVPLMLSSKCRHCVRLRSVAIWRAICIWYHTPPPHPLPCPRPRTVYRNDRVRPFIVIAEATLRYEPLPPSTVKTKRRLHYEAALSTVLQTRPIQPLSLSRTGGAEAAAQGRGREHHPQDTEGEARLQPGLRVLRGGRRQR